ncbi:MAG: glycoside hydrolase family 3 protein [Gemmatimonadaceae bacterium]
MPRVARSFGLAASLVATAAGCASTRSAAGERATTRYTLHAASPDRWVETSLHRLTLRDKVAQMVWPTLWGDYVAADAEPWRRLEHYVREDHVGGFTVSVGSPTEIAAKLDALQRASTLPLLVGADLEAGAGFRARGGYYLPAATELGGATLLPPNMGLGAAALGGDSLLAYEAGRLTAREGRALGVHLAYAPVLDVNNNPGNPVINTRSYGEDPRLVAQLGAAFVRGLQDGGMIATAKHFPGHGDTDVNSHLALPTVGASRARLDSVELPPFRAAVAAGVGAVMSFHGAVPALDSSGAPGTLSPRVLTGLLRQELGFQGLVFTDAMDMRGVLDKYGAVEAAKRAVAAGADVLIQPDSVGQTIDAIVAGVREGRYTEARIDASVRRILAAKRALALDRDRLVPLDSLPLVVGDTAHEAFARRAAERAMTLVRDSLGAVPMGRLAPGARVLAITVARRSDLAAGTVFDRTLAERFPALRRELLVADPPSSGGSTPDAVARLLRTADSADVTVVSVYAAQSWDSPSARAPRAVLDLVRQLAERGNRPVVVAFGNPYLLQDVPQAPAYLVAWGGSPLAQRAAATALLGRAPITGRLPITIPGAAPLGAGITRPALPASATSAAPIGH